MRAFLYLLLTAILSTGATLHAQETGSSPAAPASGPAAGPGRSLPEHSKPQRYDLSALQSRALTFSEKMREPATELFSFFALLALIWTGYHAQFRGLQEFVGSLLRIVITAAAITEYRTVIDALLNSRESLFQIVVPTGTDCFAAFSAAISQAGGAVTVLSLTGLAAGVALFIVVVVVLVVYCLQLLLEAVLIALGPLAIATLAFHHSRGICTMWFKTLVGVLIVPIAWMLAAKLFTAITPGGGTATQNATDFLASIIYVASMGAIYIGMPVITVFIVNSASGAMAASVPTLVSMAGMALGPASRAFAPAGAAGTALAGTTTLTTTVAGGKTSTMISTSVPAIAPGATPSAQTAYEQRILAANTMNQQMANQLNHQPHPTYDPR
jgi:hypothetical protein